MCEKSWEDLDLTHDEVDRMTEALKKEEFRKLLLEYAEEVNDPANKKLYEDEITQLEKERGVDVTFIHPEPGFVVKTSVDGKKKAFINICQNQNIGKPSCIRCVQSGTSGLSWSLPYTQAPPKEDLDKEGKRCTVFDVVFHPDTHQLANSNARFKNMVVDTALEAVESNFNVKLDRCNLKFPKLTFKGASRATVIRKKSTTTTPVEVDTDLPPFPYPSPFVDNAIKTKPKPKTNPPENETDKHQDITNSTNSYTIPKYVVTHRSDMDIQNYTLDKMAKLNFTVPKYLVVVIHLPLLKSSKEVSLDILDKSILLVSEKPKYKLDLPLAYHVDEDGSRAEFDAKSRKLTVTLFVKNRQVGMASQGGLEDSGVESDPDHHISETSIEDDNSPKILILQEESAIRTDNRMCSVASDEAYRTSGLEEQKPFLIPDIHYTFPTFSCNAADHMLAFILHVKNVDPCSIERMDLNGTRGIHLKFASVGAGFFPLHYAFFLQFPVGFAFPEGGVSVEPWDNNVIVQVEFCEGLPIEYTVGVDETTAETCNLPSISMLSDKLKQLELEVDTEPSREHLQVEVTLSSKAELVVEVSPNHNSTGDRMDEESDEGNKSENSRDSSPTTDTPDKTRTWSESSCDDFASSPTKKGILKLKSRSLSESNADDYAWSSSLDMFTYSGSDSCIPEEEELRESKKTVRFNDIVAEKTFRANSSILGQRKKNQRKMRNKKRSNERRASESENSEGEDRDKNLHRGGNGSGWNLASSAELPDEKKNGNINVGSSTESQDGKKSENINVASLVKSLDGKKSRNINVASSTESLDEKKNDINVASSTKSLDGKKSRNINVASTTESLDEKKSRNINVSSSTESLDEKKNDINVASSTESLDEKKNDINVASSTKSLDEKKSRNINVASLNESLDEKKSRNINVASTTESLDEKKSRNINVSSTIESLDGKKSRNINVASTTESLDGKKSRNINVSSTIESLDGKNSRNINVASTTESLDEKKNDINVVSLTESLDEKKTENINVVSFTESLDEEKNGNINVVSLSKSLHEGKNVNGNVDCLTKIVTERKAEPTKTKKHKEVINKIEQNVDSSAESLSEKKTEDRNVDSSTELLNDKKTASRRKKKNRKANFHNNLIFDLDM